jgi:hypothetical protein
MPINGHYVPADRMRRDNESGDRVGVGENFVYAALAGPLQGLSHQIVDLLQRLLDGARRFPYAIVI